MKIIHIITAFGIGGAEKLLLNLINEQIKDHEVHLIYFKNKNDLIDDLDSRVSVKQIPFSFTILKELKYYFKKINPDIVHTHLGHADLIGIWSAKNIKGKIFTTLHSTSFQNNWKDNLYFTLYRLLRKQVFHKWHIVSISKSVEQVVLNKIRIKREKSHLLYNAIPNILIEKKAVKENSPIKILFVGRLTKAKSLNTLLKAIKLLKAKKIEKEFTLSIVGDGELLENLKALSLELEIQDLVFFEGEQKNVDNYYSTSDIFILPSIWEGFGIVILEAFRAKIAVITSNIEGPAELIRDNYNGLLFEPENVLELASKIEYLITNEEKRSNFAKKGYKTFTSEYSIDNYVKEINKLYLNA